MQKTQTPKILSSFEAVDTVGAVILKNFQIIHLICPFVINMFNQLALANGIYTDFVSYLSSILSDRRLSWKANQLSYRVYSAADGVERKQDQKRRRVCYQYNFLKGLVCLVRRSITQRVLIPGGSPIKTVLAQAAGF